MSKTRLIAISGICGAVAVVCMLLCSIAGWVTLILSVLASIAVVIPLLVDSKGLVYSLLVYAVASVLGVFAAFSLGSVVNVAPCIAFCIPFAIVKVRGESVKPDGAKRLPAVVRWVLYYVLLEIALGLTVLVAYLFVPALFQEMVSNPFFYLLLGASQLVVMPYDLLMRGCIVGTTKILRKVIKK